MAKGGGFWVAIRDRLIEPLEYQYPPFDIEMTEGQARWVVVLGGGHERDIRLPANSQLSDTTLARLVEGIRVQRLMPTSKLIRNRGQANYD